MSRKIWMKRLKDRWIREDELSSLHGLDDRTEISVHSKGVVSPSREISGNHTFQTFITSRRGQGMSSQIYFGSWKLLKEIHKLTGIFQNGTTWESRRKKPYLEQ